MLPHPTPHTPNIKSPSFPSFNVVTSQCLAKSVISVYIIMTIKLLFAAEVNCDYTSPFFGWEITLCLF